MVTIAPGTAFFFVRGAKPFNRRGKVVPRLSIHYNDLRQQSAPRTVRAPFQCGGNV
jgi:hypothetical protein